jgi:hypothetical protein
LSLSNRKRLVADEEMLQAIADFDGPYRFYPPSSLQRSAPFQEPLDAAREAIEIQSAIQNNQNRLVDLHHRMEALNRSGAMSGSSNSKIFRMSGVDVRFFSLPQKQADRIQAECAEIVARLPAKRLLVAVIDRSGQFNMPAGADPVRLPPQTVRPSSPEAAKIERT